MNPILSWTIGLTILLAAILGWGPILTQNRETAITYGAAYQVMAWDTATAGFATAQSAKISTDATSAGGVFAYGLTDLKTYSQIDSKWIDVDPYGQTREIVAHQDSPGLVRLLIMSCGGDTIPDITLRDLALHAGNDAAYISADDPTHINAAHGQFQWDVSDFSSAGCSLTAGHLGAGIYLNGNQLVSPHLSRFAIAGHPEATQEEADTDWTNHNFTNAATVQANTQMTSPQYCDKTNPSTYCVIPAGTSTINALTASGNVQGNQMFSTGYYHLSDERLKTNKQEIAPETAAAVLSVLTGYTFDWAKDGTPDIGFMCQRLREVIPQATGTTPDGYCTVKYDVVIPIIVQAQKSYAARLDDLDHKQQEYQRQLALWERWAANLQVPGVTAAAEASNDQFQN